jgi:hypothetical protein
MNAQAPTARIGGLIRMLGASNDAEALAAARALGRCLAVFDMDFHSLTAIVERSLAPKADHATVLDRHPDWTHMASWLLDHGENLKPAELACLRRLRNWPIRPSKKTLRWLGRLYAREIGRAR